MRCETYDVGNTVDGIASRELTDEGYQYCDSVKHA